MMSTLTSCPLGRLISLFRHPWRCSDVAILVLGRVEEWHRSSLWLCWRKILTRRENSWHLLGLKIAILGLGLSPRRGCLPSLGSSLSSLGRQLASLGHHLASLGRLHLVGCAGV